MSERRRVRQVPAKMGTIELDRGGGYGPIAVITSPSEGKRPSRSLENTSRPSTVTSKHPPEPFSSVASTSNSSLIAAARLAALGL